MSPAGRDTHERQSLSDAVKDPDPKPPLGPPHDAWATVGLAVFFASGLYFVGHSRAENDWIGWSGLILSFAALLTSLHYFVRAYGFRSKGWQENIPTGAYFALFFAFFSTISFVAPALYNQFAEESRLGLVLSLLSVSALTVATLRAALGHAPKPEISSSLSDED
ncbi:hypothetical protein FEF26_04860 [Nesterenkonia salmonea]|uniref:Uncharacterized protein n=1 Tax=Nesterenkonia salmonea TaxID=1804987 RepID=A0A5R9BE68_9MICC|nr:hypothetical protein [Nesterenkonia salmonea]TLP98491.1 hypothetical protein FEF26_04860 [Nesterenkonia salmonea]